MSAIQSGLAEIKAGIALIQSQLTDVEYQNALQVYTQNANTVTGKFTTFVDAAAGLQNADPKVQQDAINDLFAVLALDSAQDVATAMADIHSEVAGQGALKGLIVYQVDVCHGAVAAWAAESANLTTWDVVWGDWTDNLRIVTLAAPATLPQALEGSVLTALRAPLMAQLQGLLLLIAAWGQTEQAPQLQTVVDDLAVQIAAMRALYSTLTDPSAFDLFVEQAVRAYAVPCPGSVLDSIYWEDETDSPNRWHHWTTPPIDARGCRRSRWTSTATPTWRCCSRPSSSAPRSTTTGSE